MSMRPAGAAVACAALLLLAPGFARAQGQPAAVQRALAATTPSAFAEAYLPLMTRGEFDQAAMLMHPDALTPVRRIVALILRTDPSGEARRELLGVDSDSAFAALSDAQVFAKFLAQVLAQQPGMLEAMKTSTATIIGVVTEGGDSAHVVWRSAMSMQGLSVSKMEVLSLRRAGTGWRAMLTGDLDNFLKGMELGMSQRGAPPR